MRTLTLIGLLLTSLGVSLAHADLLGMDLAPLLQLVAGQVTEIERLTETIGFAKDQAKMLTDLNRGIERVVSQIETLQQIVERTRRIDPRSIKSLADINDLLAQAQLTKTQIDALLASKFGILNQAIGQSSLQADTSFKMGQEMVATGANLALESKTASPGRAGQITAASTSATMLAQGVQLQSLSHLIQLQALTLDLQKSAAERDFENERKRRVLFEAELSTPRKRGRK